MQEQTIASVSENQNLSSNQKNYKIGSRYQVIEELGKGGMGKVLKAIDKETDNLCAIKLMHNHMRQSETNLKRFEREAQLAINLAHPNIVSTVDFGTTVKSEPFIVMEYLDGISLDQFIEEKKRISLPDFYTIFRQVCEGLKYSHASDVVHRDIKPSNIMVLIQDKIFLVKIVDFGIARVCKNTGDINCPSEIYEMTFPNKTNSLSEADLDKLQQLTQPGEIFGSPLYMSPEQFEGEAADCCSEVYGLGCMMFEALTGRAPLKGNNAMETLFERINNEAPSINSLDSGLKFPEQLELVVSKALKRDREDRYQEVEDVLNALDAISDTLV